MSEETDAQLRYIYQVRLMAPDHILSDRLDKLELPLLRAKVIELQSALNPSKDAS